MDAWSQLERWASSGRETRAAEGDCALRLARELRPALGDLPRILDLADALNTQTDREHASTSPAADSPAPVGDRLEQELVDGLLVKLSAAVNWHDISLRDAVSDRSVERIGALYLRLGEASRGRYVLLELLAAEGGSAALTAFADLLVRDPPTDSRQVGMAFLPLFQQRRYTAEALFPRLLDALARPETATLTLDLANHVMRQGLLARHPAAKRSTDLAGLLGGVVQRLLRMQQHPPDDEAAQQARRKVADWVALCVSLCDALGLLGDRCAVGPLRQALDVGHRRLRAEAAGALARLGEERGLDVLVELAGEPATRSRALAYLAELGSVERVAEDQRTPGARAAGELAQWLGQPSQLGISPSSIELVDHCRQYWPGYEEPVDCFLLRFAYRLPQGEYSNVGIVGPLTRALTADLEELVPADVYALFAGWQAEHAEISEISADDLPDDQQQLAAQRLELLRDRGFTQVALHKRAEFFGEQLLVATAVREETPGTVILDGEKIEWYPRSSGPRAIGPDEALWMHKGRKLLAAFNPACRDD